MSKKCVLCYSGGLDSTVLLYLLKKEGYDIHCLTVDYRQKHSIEIRGAKRIAREVGADWKYIDLGIQCRELFKGSSQTDDSVVVPEGHYTDETMKATVVPNRNMILLSLATAWAVSLKAEYVAYAAHAGDHAIYPDCRPAFVMSMRTALWNASDDPLVNLYTPFIDKTKTHIVTVGAQLNVPFEKTYSCYKGGEKHCGKCGTCVERREAFKLASVPDPTYYLD